VGVPRGRKRAWKILGTEPKRRGTLLSPIAVRRPKGSSRLGGYKSYRYGELGSERTLRVGVGFNLK